MSTRKAKARTASDSDSLDRFEMARIVPVDSSADRQEQVIHKTACSAGSVLDPRNKYVRWWQLMVILTVTATCIVETYMASIDSTVWPFWAAVYLCDAVFLADIVMTFFVGFVNDIGITVKDRKIVRKRYLTRTFVIDLLSVLPTDIFAVAFPGNSVWKTLTLVRLNRLIRCYRISTFFSSREAELGANMARLRSIKYLIICSVSTHWIGCGWYALACSGKHWDINFHCDATTSWISTAILNGVSPYEKTATQVYVRATLYWAFATATSTGFGDISAITENEKWYSIMAMLVGIGVFFGMLLGGMTSMLTIFDAQRASFVHRVDLIRDHLKEYNVTTDLKTQVVGFYDYFWGRKKGVASKDIYGRLPKKLQAELVQTTSSHILKKAPIFDGFDEGFLRTLSLNIAPVLYLPKQIIISKGVFSQRMFFLHRGEVEVLSEDDKTPIATIKSGKLFGEVSLLRSLPRTATIRALTHCDIMVLEKEALQALLPRFPEVSKRLRKKALDRVNQTDEEVASSSKKEFRSLQLFQAFQTRQSSYVEPSRFKDERHSFAPVDEDSGPTKKYAFGQQAIALSKSLEVINTTEKKGDEGDTRSRPEQVFSRLVLDPDSKLCIIWNNMVFLLAIIIGFITPYVACFLAAPIGRTAYFQTELGTVLLAGSYIVDVIFLFDILVQLRTSVVTPHGNLRGFRDMANYYCKSRLFLYDVIAVFPLELFSLMESDMHSRRLIYAFLRINRVAKLLRLFWMFNEKEKNLSTSIVKLRTVKFLLVMVLLTHWLTCYAFVSNCYNRDTCNTRLLKPEVQFVRVLYFAVLTMTSTGYESVPVIPTNRIRVCVEILMVLGLLLYGYCMAQMAATRATEDAANVTFQERMLAVMEYMKDRNLGDRLKQRVINNMQMMWDTYRGCWMPGQPSITYDLSPTLQSDIALDDVTKTFGKTPLFKDAGVSILRALTLKIQRYLFSPGEIVVYAWDVGREMYCVRRGYCEIVTPDLKETVAMLGPGQWFGVSEMLFGERRAATIRADTHCELLQLSFDDFTETLKDFPLLQSQFDTVRKKNLVKQPQTEERSFSCLSTSTDFEDFVKVVKETNIEIQNQYEVCNWKPEVPPCVETFEDILPNGQPNSEYLDPFKELNPIARVFSKLLMRRVFLQSGKFIRHWAIFMIIVSMVQVITVPLQAAFLPTEKTLWAIHYVLDAISIVNLYVDFHTTFYNDQQVLVIHPLSTAKNYLRTNFLINFISVFPFEIFAFAASPHFEYADLQLFSLARLNRVLQIFRLQVSFSYLERDVQRETGYIRMWKYSLYTISFIHWVCCALFLAECPPTSSEDAADFFTYFKITTTGHTCFNIGWFSTYAYSKQAVVSQIPLGTLYTISWYFASATSFSVGYGDIFARTPEEMGLTSVIMIMAVIFFANVIAGVAAGMANADAQRARFQERLEDVKRFMKDQRLHQSLQGRVVSFYEYLWLRTHGVSPDTLFDGLPQALCADVTYSVYRDMITKISLFQDTEVSFIKMLSMRLKLVFFTKGEYIVRKNNVGSEMFFIFQGAVDVVTEDGKTVLVTMKAGSSFGEVALLFDCPRTASVRAQVNSDLFQLSKSDLDEVLEYYPAIKQNIMMIGQERRLQAQKRSAEKLHIKKNETHSPKEPHQPSCGDENLWQNSNEEDNSETLALEALEVDVQGNTNQNNPDDGSESQAASGMSRFRQVNRFTIHPTNRTFQCYDSFMAVVGYVSAAFILYQLGYQDRHGSILAINYICDILFIVEIYFKFHLSYYNDLGHLVEDFDVVCDNYLKKPTGFPVDLVANIPIEVFALCASNTDDRWKALSLLRIIHLLRLIRVSDYFSHWEKELDINMLTVRLCKYFFILTMVFHLFSSLWYIVSCPLGDCTALGWVNRLTAGAGYDKSLSAYCTCLYWCVATMTSTGYGDVTAYTVVEMWYASFVMLCGKLIFGYVLGGVASTLANAGARRMRYELQLQAVENYMDDQEVPKALRQRVFDYHEYLWIRFRGEACMADLFTDAPYCLVSEIYLDITKTFLTSVPLFEGAEDSFLFQICQKVNLLLFMPGDYIARRGDVEKVYFVHRGEVELTQDKNPNKPTTTRLQEGSVFGEVGLICGIPRQETVQARTHVDLLTLSRDHFEEILHHYPVLEERIHRMGEERFGPLMKEHGL